MKKDAGTVVREFLDAFNANNVERAMAHCTKDARATVVPLAMTGSAKEGFELWKRAFPDGKADVTSLIAQEDKVVVELVARGTHKGPFHTPSGDIAPTHRKAELPWVQVYELTGGKISAMRSYFDGLGFFRALGIGEPRIEERPLAH